MHGLDSDLASQPGKLISYEYISRHAFSSCQVIEICTLALSHRSAVHTMIRDPDIKHHNALPAPLAIKYKEFSFLVSLTSLVMEGFSRLVD